MSDRARILVVAATARELAAPGDWLTLLCGVGPVDAAASTAAGIAALRPSAILHVGIAGARRAGGLLPGTFVIGSEARYCDLDVPADWAPRHVAASPTLLAALQHLLPDSPTLPIGTSARVGGTTGCDIEAMEGFGVLRAAQFANVPAIEVRADSKPATPDLRGPHSMPIAHYWLEPPYTSFKAHRGSPMREPSQRPGRLMCIRPTHDAEEGEVFAEIEQVHATLAGTTIVLWLDLIGLHAAATLISGAARRAVRGFVTKAVPDPLQLRRQLAARRDLSLEFTRWIERQGFHLSRHVRAMITASIDGAVRYRDLTELAGASRRRTDLWRADLHRAGLGSAQKFHQLLRLLAIAVHIQREPKARMVAIAEHYRYYDAAALRRRLGEVLGNPPSVIREFLGWEWMAYTALRRAGISTRRSPRSGGE
jgi:futalosine hydrolase